MVFIVVQILVGIDAVVSILSKFLYFASLALKCLFTPLLSFLGQTPEWGGISTEPPKGISLCEKTS